MVKWMKSPKAYKFGTLIDAVITEPFKVDYFKFQVMSSVFRRRF
jgi:hypothetical protein